MRKDLEAQLLAVVVAAAVAIGVLAVVSALVFGGGRYDECSSDAECAAVDGRTLPVMDWSVDVERP